MAYHLLYSLYLRLTSLPEYSILVLGLDGAGKTTLHNQIKAIFSTTPDAPPSNPGRTVPTVGQNVSVVTLPDLYLRIWDVGGQHSLRKLWQSYYQSCHAIVFVIDSTDIGDADISRLPEMEQEGDAQSPISPKPRLQRSFSTMVSGLQDEEASGRLLECRLVLEDVLAHSEAEGVPLLVLANKQDREDCVEVVRIKEGFVRKVMEGEQGGSVRDSRVLPISALTGTGVKEAVDWLCSRVKWNKEARPPVMR
jgi:ADP-ribosylation factor related protein 1